MRGRKNGAVPRRLARAMVRFSNWRQSHEPGTRIPRHLWAVAVRLASRYGVSRTAVALKLNYGGLKRRVEARTVEARPRRAAGAIPAFVELPGPMLAAPSECLIECENAAGSKMRIHLKGGQAADLVALSGSFWGAQP